MCYLAGTLNFGEFWRGSNLNSFPPFGGVIGSVLGVFEGGEKNRGLIY